MSELDRAEQLSEAIDQLLAGQLSASNDPLLEVARELAATSLQPSAGAVARFQSQVDGWFPTPLPPAPVKWIPFAAGSSIIAIVTITLIVIASHWPVVPPPAASPTHTNTSTATPTATQTATPTSTWTATPSATDTQTATPSVTPTATDILTASPTASASLSPESTLQSATTTLTAFGFARVVIEGTIESIKGNIIVVLGTLIQYRGGVGRLCVGDLVRVEAPSDSGGLLQADRSNLQVIKSACAKPPPPTPKPGGKGDKDDDEREDHGKKD